MVMVDFEMVDFEEPNSTSFSEQAVQRMHIEKSKSMYLELDLENRLLVENRL